MSKTSRRVKKLNPIKLSGNRGPRARINPLVEFKKTLSPTLAEEILTNSKTAKAIGKWWNISPKVVKLEAERVRKRGAKSSQ